MKRKHYEDISTNISDFLVSGYETWDIPNAGEYASPVCCASTYGNAIRRMGLTDQLGVCQNGFDVCLYKQEVGRMGVRRLAAEAMVYDTWSVDERAGILIDFLDSNLRCVEIVMEDRSVRAGYDVWSRQIKQMGYKGQLRISMRGHHLYLLKENRWFKR